MLCSASLQFVVLSRTSDFCPRPVPLANEGHVLHVYSPPLMNICLCESWQISQIHCKVVSDTRETGRNSVSACRPIYTSHAWLYRMHVHNMHVR